MYLRWGKRCLDLVVATTALLFLWPVMLIVAVLVAIKLGRPVFFRQERLGKDGRVFSLIKFRSMTNECDADGDLLPDGDRLPPFGKFLRSSSLDELPELINIIRGEMSLVGPRPLLVRYRDRYTERQFRRHEVLPGLTGWCQVYGRNATDWDTKFENDLHYIKEQSLVLDLKLLFMTIPAVLSRRGVSREGQATATEFMGSES